MRGESTGTFITVGQVAAYEVSEPATSARSASATESVERVTTRGGLPTNASLSEILEAVD